jgi:hypothetical protein
MTRTSRIWLLCGALAASFALSGCIATMTAKSMGAVNALTGANDPNETGFLATAGRWQNAGTAAVAGAVGVEVDPALTAVPPSLPAAAPAEPNKDKK